MDYKETLNLPKTAFPMKGDLPIKEPRILEIWEHQDIYKKIRDKYKGAPKYILHDGPPYANGNIHIGHALNKTLKDIVIKFKTMRGFDAPYIPGWDCHGMPIEHQLFKELKKTKHDVDQVEFRHLAYKFAMKFVDIQREEFKRLGVFGDWSKPYLTLSSDYEKLVVSSFNKLAKKGFIYRGLKPINWCAKCETALAEAEVEYEEHLSPSIYIKFKVKDSDAMFLVWTTTPWTLVSNVAVAVHPGLSYVLFNAQQQGTLIIAEELLDAICEKTGIKGEVIKKVKGSELEGLEGQHPFLNRFAKVILAGFVSKEEGTGCVHIAPGHGQEDYDVGGRYNLPIIMPIDDKGRFVKKDNKDNYEIPDCIEGKDVFSANKDIVKILQDNGSLLLSEEIQHSYPHCWRCHEPLLFRATKQWFVGIDKNELRSNTLSEIKKIKWVPLIGENRIFSMIEGRPDWCLSRQRYWGVPIPILYCDSCGLEIINEKVMERIEGFFAKEGSNIWFLKDAGYFVPEDFSCPKCGCQRFKKEMDILDVWFESGASHQAVLKNKEGMSFPADLYLEGSDQHRGWFQTSLLISMAVEGKPSFKNVLTHGFVVDGDGKKMSKSAGNVIAPQEIISKKGADVLRLWVSSSSYFDDIRISEEILLRTVEAYRKFRNTAKFLLGNIYDFDYEKDSVDIKDMLEIDRWALSITNSVLKDITESYEKFRYHEVVSSLYKFCIVEMSNFYFDILKDRLYTFARKSKERRSSQTSLFKILDIMVRELAPLIPFTAEEIWFSFKKEGSVHLSCWPEVEERLILPELENRWDKLKDFRNEVLKALEEKRSAKLIGSSLEAKITLYIKDELEYNFLTSYLTELPVLFIVSQVNVQRSSNENRIEVFKADGNKCSRCWNWSIYVGIDKTHPLLCPKCCDVVREGG